MDRVSGFRNGHLLTVGQPYSTPSAVSFDVRAGLARGSLRFEARTTLSTRLGERDCIALPSQPIEGVETTFGPGVKNGGPVLTDARIGYTFGLPANRELLASAGGGKLWGRDVWVLAFAAGVRSGNSPRLALDVEGTAYRIPWTPCKSSGRTPEIVPVISREREYDWSPGYVLRFGIEFTR